MMDSEEKCTTWVGNICKKVETWYSGIDNIISQESFQYAENQFSTTGANLKQFAENQLLTAGTNVKQFCSEFMQEMLPEFLKDSLQEKTPFLEETQIHDVSSCEILKKDVDEGHKDELAKSNYCDEISSDGKEMSLEQNPIKVSLVPSDITNVEAPEKDDIGMTPSICGVNWSHAGGVEGQVTLPSPKSAKSHSSYSSAKVQGTAEPEYAQVDSSTVYHFTTVSAGFDECKILEDEVSSSSGALSKALNAATFSFHSPLESCSEFVEAEEIVRFSLSDGGGDSKAEQAKNNHISTTGMNITEPVNMPMIDHDCLMLGGNKICSTSDLQVEDPTSSQSMDNFCLKVKFEKEWEFIHPAGSEDHDAESDQPRGKSLGQPLQRREREFNYHDFCESEWEMV